MGLDFPSLLLAARIHTTGVTFHYVDIGASIFFWGQMESMDSRTTELSIRLPVQGIHTILASGGICKWYPMAYEST